MLKYFYYFCLLILLPLAQVQADEVISADLHQRLANVGATEGSPIHIVVLKRTQEEFDQNSSIQDSYNPHPSQVPAAPLDMKFYKHGASSSDNGYEQWELDNLKDASFKPIGKQVNKGNVHLGQMQIWIRNSQGAYVLLKTYPISAYGGPLGPKTRQGDFQTPEGFYKVTELKPGDLVDALALNFPNTYDSRHKQPGVSNLGGSILIHGEDITVGCLAMGNNIKEIYALAAAAKKSGQTDMQVSIFPFPLTNANLSKIPNAPAGASLDFKNFWKKMQPGYQAFQQTHLPPTITFDAHGDYVVNDHLPQSGPNDILKNGFGSAPSCVTCTHP